MATPRGDLTSSVDSGSTASYVYNALGERVEKDLSGTYTEYAFDKDGEPEAENNRGSSNGGWVDSWVNFEGQHLAHYENNGVYYIYGNQVGTAGIVTDWTGAVVQDELHYPWGKYWASVPTTPTEERFASLHHRDSATNLDPTHFRMYSSDEGRWLTPDPAQADIFRPQSMNRYAYAVNSPVSLTDPSGLGCTSTSGANGKLTTVCTVTAQAGGDGFLGPLGLSGYNGPSPLIYRPGGVPKGGCCRTQIGPAPPPNVGPAPKPPAPVHPGTASAYLECVASAGINMAFGSIGNARSTLFFNGAPIIFSETPPAAIAATFFAGAYDINLALRIRAICTEEVYGVVR